MEPCSATVTNVRRRLISIAQTYADLALIDILNMHWTHRAGHGSINNHPSRDLQENRMLPARSPSVSRSGSRLALLLAAASIAFAPSQPHAQRYPSRTVTIVVPLAAGTGMDTIARSYGEKLASTLGQPVIVENKPGGAFILATQSVIAAP